MLYHLARFYDEWPGEDYDGSSCRGALKAWHKHGVCSDELWPYRDSAGRVRFIKPKDQWAEEALHRRLGVYYRVNRASIVDMQAAILEIGAIYARPTCTTAGASKCATSRSQGTPRCRQSDRCARPTRSAGMRSRSSVSTASASSSRIRGASAGGIAASA